jgi:hypothetical protein
VVHREKTSCYENLANAMMFTCGRCFMTGK